MAALPPAPGNPPQPPSTAPTPGQLPQPPAPPVLGQYPPYPGQYPQPYPGQYPGAYPVAGAPRLHRRTFWMTVSQVLVIIEAVVGLLFGILAVVGGIFLLTNIANFESIPGLNTVGGTAFLNAAAGIYIGAGVVALIFSMLWLWAGIALGRPSNAARWIVIVFASLAALLYVFSLLGSTVNRTGAATLTLVILLAVQVIIVYSLAIDPNTRHAYSGR